MTVSYTSNLAAASIFGCFWRILFRWRGSVYKGVWLELLVYILCYYAVNLTCRFTLNTDFAKSRFYEWQGYLLETKKTIPMAFVLGFYVTLVVNRWWQQFQLLPWPDTMAILVSAAISPPESENKDEGRMMRRTIMRYTVLAYVLTLMKVSLRARKRFPSYRHVINAGLMLESEKDHFETMDKRDPMSKQWIPLVWATNIIYTARKQEFIECDQSVQTIMVEMADIRQRLNLLIGFDFVSVPLVYTQVVTLAVYLYFLVTLISYQMLPDPPDKAKNPQPNLYFPITGIIEFVFYVGWLKVAEILSNPFGEDEDSVEVNWLIDRHFKASYMIVDEMHDQYPELLQDPYWDEVVPTKMPYTKAAQHYRRDQPIGSAEHFKIKDGDTAYEPSDHSIKNEVPLQTETEDV